MRKVIFSILSLAMLTFAACKSDDTPEPTTAQKLLGKWRLQKAIDEYYQPMNVLVSTDEVIGEPGDSVVFKNNNQVYSYSDTDGEDVTEYQLLNDTTILIEDEMYRIRKLTSSELNLYLDHSEPMFNQRYVQYVYFVK